MSSKIKLSDKGKQFLSGVIVVIVLLFLSVPEKKMASNNEIVEKDNYIIKIDYPEVDNKNIASLMRKYINDKKTEFISIVKDLENKEFSKIYKQQFQF